MSVKIKLKHSSVANKAPQPSDLDNGELALNTNAASPAAYLKDSNGSIVKLAGAGAIGDAWTRTGTALSPANAGDVVNISAGTAALPGLTPVGDPDTGIYSPGADRVAVATGGVQRVTVDANGNVGIGVGAPSNYSGDANNLVIASGDNVGITIAGSTTGKSSIYFADAPTGVGASVGRIEYDHTDDYLRFNVKGAERVRIDASGRLLVGVSTPLNSSTAKLQCATTANITTTVYADNTAAKAGGLVAGDIYRKADGTLMITF